MSYPRQQDVTDPARCLGEYHFQNMSDVGKDAGNINELSGDPKHLVDPYLPDNDQTLPEDGIFDETEDYDWDLVVNRLNGLANLLRTKPGSLPFDRSVFTKIIANDWNVRAILETFKQYSLLVDYETVRAIVRDPSALIGSFAMPPLSDNEMDQTGDDINNLETWDEEKLQDDFIGGYAQGVHSSHPSGQVLRTGETFEPDPNNPGGYLVRFRRQLPNGRIYELVDELPNFDPNAQVSIPVGEKPTRIGGNPRSVPPIVKSDPGIWVPKQFDPLRAGGTYVRQYPPGARPKGLAYAKIETEPIFVIRKFDRRTGEYQKRFIYGLSWESWDQRVQNFDINNAENRRSFERWLRQLLERWDQRYHKRTARETWKAWEIIELRQYFNDFIEDHGLIMAYFNPKWDVIVDRINALRQQQVPNAELRNHNAVSSMAERDMFACDDPRMGIHDWRQLGNNLKMLKTWNPAANAPDSILKPRNCIPMDNIVDKKPGGDGVVRVTDRGKRKGCDDKVKVEFENGQFYLTDRFSGALIARHFPAAVKEPAEQEMEEEHDGVEENDEWDDEWEDCEESGEPEPKRPRQ
ncbi:hypothetical protein K504DRAFT_448004 [Pleomassaria siparia CBS 279.74]|uniref:Uncharacterized protein n=1 Tax=Pleomassaria siparia CBS 279.74 TaxID=1314801 RepID=A0A6G1K0P1_9PLEO|nr:hypothetical protein K504DRAFT_448004 [Pleomassaria siparia CBS 279.74]